MPNTPKTKLREEWNKWLFKEEGNTHTYKLPNSDEISDWWLARFQEELSLLEEKMGELRDEGDYTDEKWPKETQIEVYGYNNGVDRALTLLRQHK